MTRLLYFTAAWCGPCRSYGPLLTREAEARGLRVERIDLDEVDGRSMALAHDVRSVPTVVAIRDGETVARFGTPAAGMLGGMLDDIARGSA
ncbi:thioredoxin family protein [Micromonospora chokoriensis]